MTNEQWAFCAGIGTGVSVFVVGCFCGAFVWHNFLVWRSRCETEKKIRNQEAFRKQFEYAMKKNPKEPNINE